MEPDCAASRVPLLKARLAVAGFIAGGRAALDAIERAEFDVIAFETKPRKRDLARRLVGAWL